MTPPVVHSPRPGLDTTDQAARPESPEPLSAQVAEAELDRLAAALAALLLAWWKRHGQPKSDGLEPSLGAEVGDDVATS